MTITIDGVDTVIRKDNCKVQAFGDVVRITDYKGSIYEFLYSDCTAPDEPTANDLRDAIEEFLNTGGGGGGGGITTLTSTDGSISIDNTDPNAPDLSIPNGEWTPTISAIINSATVDVTAALYSRSGNVVNFSIGLDIQLDAGFVSTQFKISLPVASNFSNARQLIFSANLPTNLTFCVGSSSSADNLMVVDVIGTANGDTIESLQITGQYLIV